MKACFGHHFLEYLVFLVFPVLLIRTSQYKRIERWKLAVWLIGGVLLVRFGRAGGGDGIGA